MPDTPPTEAPPIAPHSPEVRRSAISAFSFQLSAFSSFLSLAAFSVLWIDLIRQLSYQWSTNEQYAYGWFVPFLALGLILKKWPYRPTPSHRSSVISDQSSVRSISAFSFQLSAFLPALCVLFALLLLPLRVIHEINQDWPLITWPLTIGVVAISLYAVFLIGGWRWVKYFGFPICFILVAVRWPYRIERSLTQNLMQVVAKLTVEMLGWLNVPALQRGNIIEISTGVVGIDEACSGIRSFQSTLMAALFLGELYLLRWRIRLLLVAAGLAAAFLLNLCRTLILTWEANKNGLSAVDKWHDPAGFTIAVACFVVLWLIAVMVKRKWSTAEQRAEDRGQKTEDSNQSPVASRPQSEGSGLESTFQSAPSAFSLQPSALPPALRPLASDAIPSSALPAYCSSLTARRPSPLPRFFIYSLTGWVALMLIGNEAWYRSHEVRQADTARWWVNYPTNLPSFRAVTASKYAQKLLQHDAESGGAWEEPDGTKWTVYCFRWRAGDATARMSALSHRPEYCLVGSGHNLVASHGTRYLPANGLELPFRLYTFNSAERPLHVFFCLWEDGTETQPGFGRNKYLDRLSGVLAGRRGMGQQTLEIICSGYSSMEEADKAVRQRLPDLIDIEK